jgi:hypothetical protein
MFCVEYSGTFLHSAVFRRCVVLKALGELVWHSEGNFCAMLRYDSHLAESGSLLNMHLPGT